MSPLCTGSNSEACSRMTIAAVVSVLSEEDLQYNNVNVLNASEQYT